MIASFTALCRSVRADIGQEFRYAHTLRVARLADRMAQAYGEDAQAARIAGMLHDLARLYSTEALLEACAARGMPVDDFERSAPIVLHARVGAELARERYGVADERILSAIRAHTLGAPAMSRLDAILYLADALEAGRDFPEREALLRTAFRDLEESLRLLLASTVAYQRSRGLTIAPQTLAALKYYSARGAGRSVGEENDMEDRLCLT